MWTDLLADLHPWIKALHIISVIAWMAGLLYLPRLYVYHCDASAGSPQSETFKIMERRLLRGIMNPAMAGTFIFGILLLLTPGVVDWGAAWIYLKLMLVMGLSHFHHLLARWRQDFAADRNSRPVRFYRFANEVPTALMILIVILIVVRPF
ncbi:MAG TPA: protoporphyrinogen oxidase HemJ [Verrucomicrobiae bacterium]|nr:protoporphyrinogen oxidase HemJ [Verrucomicrobiae bacterium]